MPVVINEFTKDQVSLEDFLERLRVMELDPSDANSLMSASSELKMLANNRTFLAEFIATELKNYNNFQRANTYSSQTLMLDSPSRDKKYFIRANIWPAKEDYMTLIHGEDAFFYHKPHDHNFNFLTVGYLGSGYWSDYYEYEYDKVIGYPGEDVALRFVERSALSQGKVMMYRAHVDVHDQLPADEFSISINIMENSIGNPILDQYSFDIRKGKIKSIINSNSTKALFDIIAINGNDNHLDILDHIASKHFVDRVRLNAIEAMSKTKLTNSDVICHYKKWLSDSSQFIRENVNCRIESFEKSMK